MSPEILALNPVLADLPQEFQEEVQNRILGGDISFLAMRADEIMRCFEDEKRLKEQELKKAEEERILAEERERLQNEDVRKSDIFQIRKVVVNLTPAATFRERIVDVGRWVWDSGGSLGLSSLFGSMILQLFLGVYFNLNIIAIFVWLLCQILIWAICAGRNLQINTIGLLLFSFNLLFFVRLWFGAMPICSLTHYKVFSRAGEVIEIVRPGENKFIDTYIVRKSDMEEFRKEAYIDRLIDFENCYGKISVKFFQVLNHDGLKQWFKIHKNVLSVVDDLRVKVRAVLEKKYESRDKLDIAKIASKILELQNSVLSIDAVEVNISWKNISVCRKSCCEVIGPFETFKLSKE